MEGESEEGVGEGPAEGACEAESVLSSVGVFLRKWKGTRTEGLERGAGGGEDGVEDEEGERGPEVEEGPNRERCDYLDAKRWVGEDEGGPGDVEEEEVEGG